MGGSAVEDTCRRHSHSASIHPIVTPRFAADPTGKAPKHASQLRSFHGCHSIPQLSQSLIFRIGGNTSTTFRNAIGAFLLSEYAFRNNPNRGGARRFPPPYKREECCIGRSCYSKRSTTETVIGGEPERSKQKHSGKPIGREVPGMSPSANSGTRCRSVSAKQKRELEILQLRGRSSS